MSKRLRDIVKPWGLSLRVADIEARQFVIDSRQVSEGDIFVALRGHIRDGRDFIEAAICQGACAVLVDAEQVYFDPDWPVPVIELTHLPERLGEIAARFYGVQLDHPIVVGVTGTNGKTSVSHYMAQLLSALACPAGVIGTLGYGSPSELTPLANTTPDALTVHNLLAAQAQQGKSWVCMEVSSHGLVQNRVSSVPFRHAVFTNLSRDHLDYHGSMQAYGEAKAALFTWPNLISASVNLDDAFGRQLAATLSDDVLIGYGLDCPAQLSTLTHWLTLTEIQSQSDGFSARLESSWGHADLRIPLLGRFNLSNLLAAIAPILASGYDLNVLAQAVSTLRAVAGRMELFSAAHQASVIVDYAHTPDALNEALSAARFHCRGQLWCVFGCGGERDVGKRPLMAAAAEAHADQLIITSDNPRSESQKDIAAAMLKGLSQPAHVLQIDDRQQAIQHAMQYAKPDDLIVIAGKGHEDYQIIGQNKVQFSDRTLVQQLHTLRGANL